MLEYINIIILCWVIGYGLTLGLGNSIKRVQCFIHNKVWQQSTTGYLLDSLWYAMIAYLVINMMLH